MKLQVGEIVMNKTYKYLFPCLKHYGQEFIDKINSVWKAAIGIGDMTLTSQGIHYNQHLFILMDTDIARNFFMNFMEYIKEQPMYATDYPYDDITNGHLHMVVIKLPDNCTKALEALKRSQYSMMYSQAELEKLFPMSKVRIRKVLLKDPSHKRVIVDKLNNIWNTTITVEEYDGEMELPYIQEEEYFNA